jgi:hypothetical protein
MHLDRLIAEPSAPYAQSKRSLDTAAQGRSSAPAREKKEKEKLIFSSPPDFYLA